MINYPSLVEIEPLVNGDVPIPLNPYQYDAVRMGQPISPTIEMMFTNHASEPCDNLIFVCKLTGRRWMLKFRNEGKLTDADFEVIEYRWPVEQMLHKALRKGQLLFNILFQLRPDLAELLRGSPSDPFYNDNNIPKALRLICTEEQLKKVDLKWFC